MSGLLNPLISILFYSNSVLINFFICLSKEPLLFYAALQSSIERFDSLIISCCDSWHISDYYNMLNGKPNTVNKFIIHIFLILVKSLTFRI